MGEAVRIGIRGGARRILNSKSEYDRCKIPRLVVKEQEEDKLEEKELEKAKRGLEEQAKRWSTSKYKEKREQVMRSWKEDERSRGDTMKKQEGAGFQEGNRKKKRKKYKHTFMEQAWVSGERGATEQLEQGANNCS